ncbi:MAG: hypothetical protein LBD88_02405 [Candidatus Peribacteria bacterium]|jgi:hypothetical protein|nr:hypothetical protein [Candidatus Peribacteria bacterium]
MFSSFQQDNIDYKGVEADIIDRDAYIFLSVLEEGGKLESCVVLKMIVESEGIDLKGGLVVLDFFV